MRASRGRSAAARLSSCPVPIALVLLWLRASSAMAVTLTRGPYLQLLTRQSVTVVWDTDTPATCGLALRSLDGVPMVHPGGTGTVCALGVSGLAPGTLYAYTP